MSAFQGGQGDQGAVTAIVIFGWQPDFLFGNGLFGGNSSCFFLSIKIIQFLPFAFADLYNPVTEPGHIEVFQQQRDGLAGRLHLIQMNDQLLPFNSLDYPLAFFSPFRFRELRDGLLTQSLGFNVIIVYSSILYIGIILFSDHFLGHKRGYFRRQRMAGVACPQIRQRLHGSPIIVQLGMYKIQTPDIIVYQHIFITFLQVNGQQLLIILQASDDGMSVTAQIRLHKFLRRQPPCYGIPSVFHLKSDCQLHKTVGHAVQHVFVQAVFIFQIGLHRFPVR